MAETNNTQLKVFVANQKCKCGVCRKYLGRHAWIVLKENDRAVCLTCAHLDHLVFLPAGDTALTRRTRKHSGLTAIVMKRNRASKRITRSGLLVEKAALKQAKSECRADAAQRKVRRIQSTLRRAVIDREYIKTFAASVRSMYPHCPAGQETLIAKHACRKYSGRVGRSAAAKNLDDKYVRLAVTAHVRHTETNYDELLSQMVDRQDARNIVRNAVSSVLKQWRSGKA